MGRPQPWKLNLLLIGRSLCSLIIRAKTGKHRVTTVDLMISHISPEINIQ
jgi:hypothetical protein